YVVTSDGEDSAATTIEVAQSLHRVVGGHLELKAAGILSERAHLMDVAAAGADRISTTFSPQLAAEFLAWQRQSAPNPFASPADVGAAGRRPGPRRRQRADPGGRRCRLRRLDERRDLRRRRPRRGRVRRP